MEGALVAGAECAAQVAAACLGCSSVLPECLKLARCCTRLAFVLSELGLAMREQEELRGSKSVFLAVDATVSALRQAEQLVTQCAATSPSSIWPLEDAVEFQAVAVELRSAASGLAALGRRLPADVQRDAAHVCQQCMALGFTEDELSETEEAELERVQHKNKHAAQPPRPADAASAAAAAPPAAPVDQFAAPAHALGSGAVAASERAAAAARARSPIPLATAEEDKERAAAASAAAVATEAAAEVLTGEEGEGEGEAAAAEPAAAAEQGEEEALLQEEMREEAAEAVANAPPPIVLTPSGQIALPPEAPAKGAVPARGASPLPPDPFGQTDVGGRLGSNTLQELRTFQHGQTDLAVADEAAQEEQRQEAEHALEAPADFLRLKELAAAGQAQPAAEGTAEALAALRDMHASAAPPPAGAEGDSSGAAEGAGKAASALHQSPSQAANAALDHNLAELATEFMGAASPGSA